ncbi:hypothetical protein KSF73_03235 [Burkholderiaceae bacterium DAT-1]|nr:hypothetical protein [Burkholderiaceae bacterium DAT-1]
MLKHDLNSQSETSIRRRFLKATILSVAGAIASKMPGFTVLAAEWPSSLFKTQNTDEALNRVAGAVEYGRRILLDVPDITDTPERVPVRVMSEVPSTESITIVVDRNAFPVAAQFLLTPEIDPDISVDIKIPGTTKVHALVKAGGKFYKVTREIKLAKPIK